MGYLHLRIYSGRGVSNIGVPSLSLVARSTVTLPPPTGAGGRVVRVQISFDKAADIDVVLRELGTGCRFSDVVPSFGLDFACKCLPSGAS